MGITCEVHLLQLLCSGGIVPNSPIGNKPWSLGEFVRNNGGIANRGKKVWGIDVPIGLDMMNQGIQTVRFSSIIII